MLVIVMSDRAPGVVPGKARRCRKARAMFVCVSLIMGSCHKVNPSLKIELPQVLIPPPSEYFVVKSR